MASNLVAHGSEERASYRAHALGAHHDEVRSDVLCFLQELMPGSTDQDLFEEPGALERVARLAAGWFARYFGSETGDVPGRS